MCRSPLHGLWLTDYPLNTAFSGLCATDRGGEIEDKTVNEKVQLIAQLEEEDKLAVYRIIDSMLTRSKFQDFFQKNLPAASSRAK